MQTPRSKPSRLAGGALQPPPAKIIRLPKTAEWRYLAQCSGVPLASSFSLQRAMLPKARGDGLPAERPAEAALPRPHRQDPSSDHTHPGASPAALKQAGKLKSRRTPSSEEELRTRRQTDTQRHLAAAPNRSAHAGRSQISLLAGQKRAHQEHQQGRSEKQRSRNPRVVPPTVGLRSPLQGIVPDVQAFAERQRSARSVHRRANATMLARISSLLTRVSTSMMALQSASNEVFGNVTLRMNLQTEGLSALSELWVEQPDQAALWPCGGQPSWNGATHPSLISLSAPDETDLDDIATAVRLGATEIEKSRFRRKLVRLAGVDALLPSAAEMRGATCPPKSMMLQYLNSSMPADERPRVVSDDGGPSWTEVGTLQSKFPCSPFSRLPATQAHTAAAVLVKNERECSSSKRPWSEGYARPCRRALSSCGGGGGDHGGGGGDGGSGGGDHRK